MSLAGSALLQPHHVHARLGVRVEGTDGFDRFLSTLEKLPRKLMPPRTTVAVPAQPSNLELALILFSEAGDGGTPLLDEPTNYLDADSIVWLRDYLRTYTGGLVVISHDVQLLEVTVNRIFHLDATRAVIDVYNIGWKRYLAQRETG